MQNNQNNHYSNGETKNDSNNLTPFSIFTELIQDWQYHESMKWGVGEHTGWPPWKPHPCYLHCLLQCIMGDCCAQSYKNLYAKVSVELHDGMNKMLPAMSFKDLLSVLTQESFFII